MRLAMLGSRDRLPVTLRTLKPSTRTHAGPALRKPPTPSEHRLTGPPLQARRLKLWTKNPYCQGCGVLTDYPSGFELDHIERLDQGGLDIEANCQVLCVWYDHEGKHGCHIDKTNEEVRLGAKERKFW